MTHMSALAGILATNTSLTITQFPEVLVEGYNLQMVDVLDIHAQILIEIYQMQIISSSLTNLETAIAKFLNADSRDPAGYKYGGTTTNPFWIECRLKKQYTYTNTFTAIIEIQARWSR